jgi:hypothetical protein
MLEDLIHLQDSSLLKENQYPLKDLILLEILKEIAFQLLHLQFYMAIQRIMVGSSKHLDTQELPGDSSR